jgi:hypothetical protein
MDLHTTTVVIFKGGSKPFGEAVLPAAPKQRWLQMPDFKGWLANSPYKTVF